MNKITAIIIDALFIIVFGWIFTSFALGLLYVLAISLPGPIRVVSNLIGLAAAGLIMLAVFRSKAGIVIKAAVLIALLEVIAVALGTFFAGQMGIIYALNALVAIFSIYLFYRLKSSWHYYFAVVLFGMLLSWLLVTGGEV